MIHSCQLYQKTVNNIISNIDSDLKNLFITERDMRYYRWKMAIARSLDWTSDENEESEGRNLYKFFSYLQCLKIAVIVEILEEASRF